MKKYLLFDLDGTLTDPKVGITTSVQYALHSFGIEEPDIDKLEPFIGPPLQDSFVQFYEMSEEQAKKAVEKYRERFRDIGIFENEVYAGIPKMLKKLQAHGMVLAVASSKPQVFVERILEHFDLQKYFTAVVGSELNGKRQNKDEVVQEALNRLFDGRPVQKEQVYMIGDRRFDVEGAKALQVESVGVTYGYGSMEELKEARADYIVQSVAQLEEFLLRGTEDDPFWGFGIFGRRSGFGENGGSAGGGIARNLGMMVVSILVFLLVRGIAESLFVLAGVRDAWVSGIGFLAGGLALWGNARRLILWTERDTRLNHLRRNPPSVVVMFALVAVEMVLGLNLLLGQIQGIFQSEGYSQVAAAQYSLPFWLGILIYGLVSPVAEELLFRGIVHNCLRRVFAPRLALLFSSVLFGLYHLNYVQAVYGFLMGCLIVYAYEYFGDFRAAVGIHMGINLLSYCLSFVGIVPQGLVCWLAGAGFLLIAVGCLWWLGRQKKVF